MMLENKERFDRRRKENEIIKRREAEKRGLRVASLTILDDYFGFVSAEMV